MQYVDNFGELSVLSVVLACGFVDVCVDEALDLLLGVFSIVHRDVDLVDSVV
jgi:hypothetical protein